MTTFSLPDWAFASGKPSARALLRETPADFMVDERLGFEPEGEGEHCWLLLEKSNLSTADLLQRVARLAGVPRRDLGFAGLKDRRALTRQWISVQLPGRDDPDWLALQQDAQVRVIAVHRHLRKLRRGVHSANRFHLRLTQLSGEQSDLVSRLERIQSQGFPNYFGEQRFGRSGSTLDQALAWASGGGKRIRRNQRSLYISALRSLLFNTLLSHRVQAGNWCTVKPGDVCMLSGTRSLFVCDEEGSDIWERVRSGDLHPGLPLWGRGQRPGSPEMLAVQDEQLAPWRPVALFLEKIGADLAHRPARAVPDDFSWDFCEDGALRLAFTLPAGSYATTLLREVVEYEEYKADYPENSAGNDTGDNSGGNGSE